MSFENYLKFSEVKKIIGEHLQTALNIKDFDITHAKRDTDFVHQKQIWKVNVEFRKKESKLQ